MAPDGRGILIVDDDFLIVEHLKDLVEDLGWRVCGSAATADDAVALALEHRPRAVLMDVRLRGKRDGIDAALQIYEHAPTTVIFITGSSEPDTIARINSDHPAGILIKPIISTQLEQLLRAALH